MSKFYDEKYTNEDSYWGNLPSSMARIFFQKYSSGGSPKLLDIGCGEGRDSVFFAQNGYQVTGFDASEVGVKKSIALAKGLNLSIRFFQADINNHRLDSDFEVVFSSGGIALHPHEFAGEDHRKLQAKYERGRSACAHSSRP